MLSHKFRLRSASALSLVILLSLSGCTFNQGTMTALATHNVNIPSQTIRSGVEGSDCIYFFLGIPVSGSLVPNLQEAEDRALAQAESGDAMKDVALYIDQTNFIVGSSICYRVRGDVVRIAQQSPPAAQPQAGVR